MIFLRIVTTVAEVFATVADTTWGTCSIGSSRRPSNDAKARCQEPAIFTGKSEDFKQWLTACSLLKRRLMSFSQWTKLARLRPSLKEAPNSGSYLSGLMEDALLLGRSYERRYKKSLPLNTRISTIDSVWSGRGKVATSKILSMSLTADAWPLEIWKNLRRLCSSSKDSWTCGKRSGALPPKTLQETFSAAHTAARNRHSVLSGQLRQIHSHPLPRPRLGRMYERPSPW